MQCAKERTKTEPMHDDKPIIIAEDDARGALSSDKISWGDTLFPMLVGGLVLIIVGMIAVAVYS